MSTPKKAQRFGFREPRKAAARLSPARLEGADPWHALSGDLITLQDCQHGVRRRYANCISGESVRVARCGTKLLHRCSATNNSANWKSIAHRLAEGNQIRSDLVPLEAPHMSPGSSEARLNLVGDDETTCLPHRLNATGNEAGRIHPNAITGKNTVDEQGRDANAARVQIHNGRTDLRLEKVRCLRFRHTGKR